MKKQLTIALAGNPNCGKSSMFNNLTGTHQHVGNWPGVTVEKKEGVCIFEEYQIKVVDLPGTYSLTSTSLDELVARNFILHEKPDVVINIVDASNLERNLYLTSQFLEMGVPLILCLNMTDRADSRGFKIDIGRLSEYLGIPVVPTVGHRNQGTDKLLEAIVRVARQPAEENRKQVHYGNEMEKQISILEKMLQEKELLCDRYPSRWLSIKLLRGDEEITKTVGESLGPDVEILTQIAKSRNSLRSVFATDVETIIAEQRYGFITGITKRALSKPVEQRLFLSDRIDEVVTHRGLAMPIFLFVVWLMFKITFTASEPFMRWIEAAQGWLAALVKNVLPQGSIVQGIVVDGVIGGVGSVLVFVPIIFILFFLMALVEDSGYMARIAFITDHLMQKIGLHGKAFIPMILGFGCNLPGILAARTIETERDRIITTLIIPFMSCSARLPIYAVFIGAFFSAHGGTVLFSLYLIGIITAIFMAKVLGRYVLPGEPLPLLLELPPYRMPHLTGVLIHTWNRGKIYFKKAGTIILAGCILVWLMSNLPWNPEYSRDYSALIQEAQNRYRTVISTLAEKTPEYAAAIAEHDQIIRDLEIQKASEKLRESYAGRIGRLAEPLIKQLGFDWKIGISLVGGIVGKEIFVGTLGTLYAVGGAENNPSSLREAIRKDTWPDGRRIYTPLTAFALMVFCLLYIPCLAAIATIFQETHSLKWAIFAVCYTIGVAWIASFIIYQGGRLLAIGS